MEKSTIQIKGMHCESCEMLIKDALEEQEGMIKVKISHTKGMATIFFDGAKISENQIKLIINSEGYEVL